MHLPNVNFVGGISKRKHQENEEKVGEKFAFAQIVRYQPQVINIKENDDDGPVHKITKVGWQFHISLQYQRG
jgi:hypothetical protein